MVFSKLTLALGATILGLCGWIWLQSSEIANLTAKTHAQAQTIQEQAEANQQLAVSLQHEREAVEQFTAIAQQQREKADDDVKVITRTIYKDNCARQSLPADVLKRLQ